MPVFNLFAASTIFVLKATAVGSGADELKKVDECVSEESLGTR
jgi:hypothetical protein